MINETNRDIERRLQSMRALLSDTLMSGLTADYVPDVLLVMCPEVVRGHSDADGKVLAALSLGSRENCLPRKKREHGWRGVDGITHTIDTRRRLAYHVLDRTATCGALLGAAIRVRPEFVDCMTCIAIITSRGRHEGYAGEPFRSRMDAVGVRHGYVSRWSGKTKCGIPTPGMPRHPDKPNCPACKAVRR